MQPTGTARELGLYLFYASHSASLRGELFRRNIVGFSSGEASPQGLVTAVTLLGWHQANNTSRLTIQHDDNPLTKLPNFSPS